MLVPYQRGGYPVFVGRAYQRGRGFGSVMSSVFRNLVVPAAKSVGKSLLRTGLKSASNVMRGVAEGKNVKQAFMDEVPPVVGNMVRAMRGRQKSRSRGSMPTTQRGNVIVRRAPVKRNRGRGTRPAAKRARHSDIFV